MSVPLQGEVTIFFTIEGIHVTANVAVTNAIDGLILGSDWLAANQCTWEFGRGKLMLWGHTIKTSCQKPTSYIRRIYVSEESVVQSGVQSSLPKPTTRSC